MSEKTEGKKKGIKIKVPRVSPWVISTLILLVALLVVLVSGWTITGQVVSSNGSTGTISADDAGKIAIDYINDYLLRGQATATLESVKEEDGFYHIKLNIAGTNFDSHVTLDGKWLFTTDKIDLTKEPELPEITTTTSEGGIEAKQPENSEIKTFYDSGEDICYEDGKPVIRMYVSSGCGYCKWNKPIFEKVMKEYMDADKIVVYLWEDGKNIISEEQEEMPNEEFTLMQKYNPSGSVPTFIMGCKYYRVGASYSRYENGEELEEAELRTVIEDLLSAQ